MSGIPRTAIEAMDCWRETVRDAAVTIVSALGPDPIPLHVIASCIGVDHHGLRAVLEPDRRLVVRVGQLVRPGRSGRRESAIFVCLRDSQGVATCATVGKSGNESCHDR